MHMHLPILTNTHKTVRQVGVITVTIEATKNAVVTSEYQVCGIESIDEAADTRILYGATEWTSLGIRPRTRRSIVGTAADRRRVAGAKETFAAEGQSERRRDAMVFRVRTVGDLRWGTTILMIGDIVGLWGRGHSHSSVIVIVLSDWHFAIVIVLADWHFVV